MIFCDEIFRIWFVGFGYDLIKLLNKIFVQVRRVRKMNVFRYYFLFCLPVLTANAMALRWHGELFVVPAVLLFLILLFFEIGNVLILDDDRQFGFIYYINFMFYRRTNQDNKFVSPDISDDFKIYPRFIGGFFLLLAVSLVVIVGFVVELSFFWYFNFVLLLLIFYGAPKLKVVEKNYITVGIIVGLLEYLLVSTFYFGHQAEPGLAFVVLLAIMILLKFNVFLYEYNLDTYLMGNTDVVNNYREIKVLNGLYFINLLVVYALYSFNFSLATSMIWLIPFIGFPVVVIKAVKNSRKIYKSPAEIDDLVVFHNWNLFVYQANVILIGVLALIDKFFMI